MTALLEWALFLPLVLSLVALFYGPGYFLATIFNAGPFVVRVVAAPAWTFAFVGLTSVLMHHFGVVWSRYSYTTVLLLLAGVAALSRAIDVALASWGAWIGSGNGPRRCCPSFWAS